MLMLHNLCDIYLYIYNLIREASDMFRISWSSPGTAAHGTAAFLKIGKKQNERKTSHMSNE